MGNVNAINNTAGLLVELLSKLVHVQATCGKFLTGISYHNIYAVQNALWGIPHL